MIDVCPYGVLLFPFACSPFPFVLISLNEKRIKVFDNLKRPPGIRRAFVSCAAYLLIAW
jgi:hypothetical protein